MVTITDGEGRPLAPERPPAIAPPPEPRKLLVPEKRELVEVQLRKLPPIKEPIRLPEEWTGRFPCLTADFPWCYDDQGFNGWFDVQAYRIHPPYPVMEFQAIRRSMFELDRVMHPDGAHFWGWTTKDFLFPLGGLLAEVGWEFKQIFTWVKARKDGSPTYGMGHWCRNACEFLVFAVKRRKSRKGTPTGTFLALGPEKTKTPNYHIDEEALSSLSPENYFREVRETAEKLAERCRTEGIGATDLEFGEGLADFITPVLAVPKVRTSGTNKYHSNKPEEFYKLIRLLSPGPRASIFERGAREGFETWGNEALPALLDLYTEDLARGLGLWTP